MWSQNFLAVEKIEIPNTHTGHICSVKNLQLLSEIWKFVPQIFLAHDAAVMSNCNSYLRRSQEIVLISVCLFVCLSLCLTDYSEIYE